MKVASDEKKLRDHVLNEASENRAVSVSNKKKPGAMDVDDVEALGPKPEPEAQAATPPFAGDVDAVKVPNDTCRICLKKGCWSSTCPQNPASQKGGKGDKVSKGGQNGGGKGSKGGWGKGGGKKGSWNKGGGKGFQAGKGRAYGVENGDVQPPGEVSSSRQGGVDEADLR